MEQIASFLKPKDTNIATLKKGLLGKLITQQGKYMDIYRTGEKNWVPDTKITVLNLGTTIASFKLFITAEDTPQMIDTIENIVSLPPNAVFVRNNDALSSGERFVIFSDFDSLVVRATGDEVVRL